MPGSLPSSVIRRWTGAGYKPVVSEARQPEAAEVHAAGEAAHLAGGKLLGGADRLVDRGLDHVLEHLGILRVDPVRIDLELLQHEVAAHLHGDHAAAGGRLDGLVLELLLRGHHVVLHLLDLLHHVGHVRRLGHQALGSSSGRISSASNSDTRRATSSSPLGGCWGTSGSTPVSRSPRTSNRRRSGWPAILRTASPTACASPSALRRLKESASPNATVSSRPSRATGRPAARA